jgi:hypothetical protein
MCHRDNRPLLLAMTLCVVVLTIQAGCVGDPKSPVAPASLSPSDGIDLVEGIAAVSTGPGINTAPWSQHGFSSAGTGWNPVERALSPSLSVMSAHTRVVPRGAGAPKMLPWVAIRSAISASIAKLSSCSANVLTQGMGSSPLNAQGTVSASESSAVKCSMVWAKS